MKRHSDAVDFRECQRSTSAARSRPERTRSNRPLRARASLSHPWGRGALLPDGLGFGLLCGESVRALPLLLPMSKCGPPNGHVLETSSCATVTGEEVLDFVIGESQRPTLVDA